MKVFYENYTNIYHFMDKISTRKPNGKFSGSSQERGDANWKGTNSYEMAVSLFSNGIPEEADKLKGITNAINFKSNINAVKARPKNHYYGYTPNIPAAIIGLPKSMRHIDKVPHKIKAINLIYEGTQNVGTSGETIQKAGETIFALVYIMELRGYRVKLDYVCFAGKRDEEKAVCNITLKDWRQPLDMLKLSFPLTSPAMFRRFGFRWVETVPGIQGDGWYSGYGRHIGKNDLIDILSDQGRDIKNTYVITVGDCKDASFDPVELSKNLGMKI